MIVDGGSAGNFDAEKFAIFCERREVAINGRATYCRAGFNYLRINLVSLGMVAKLFYRFKGQSLLYSVASHNNAYLI